jgi:hypothetical protein
LRELKWRELSKRLFDTSGGELEFQSSFQGVMTHGGQRAGAGRRRGARALVMRSKAEEILSTVNEEAIWQRLLRSRNARIVLDAMKYLTDRRDGKPVQAINAEVTGSVNLAEVYARRLKRLAEAEESRGEGGQ